MSQEVEKAAPPLPPPPAPQSSDGRGRFRSRGSTLLRWVGALIAGLVVFGAFVLANGADPIAVYADIWTSTLTQPGQFQQRDVPQHVRVEGDLHGAPSVE